MKKYLYKGQIVTANSKEEAKKIVAGKFPYKSMKKSALEILLDNPHNNSIKLTSDENADVCPFCGSDDIDFDSFEYEDETWGKKECGCNKCKAAWSVDYLIKPTHIFLRKESEVANKDAHYSVWAGGSEINDSQLTLDEAKKVAKSYKKMGYDDVSITDNLTNKKVNI